MQMRGRTWPPLETQNVFRRDNSKGDVFRVRRSKKVLVQTVWWKVLKLVARVLLQQWYLSAGVVQPCCL